MYGKLKEGMTSSHEMKKKVTPAMYQPLEGSHRSGPRPRGHTLGQSQRGHKGSLVGPGKAMYKHPTNMSQK